MGDRTHLNCRDVCIDTHDDDCRDYHGSPRLEIDRAGWAASTAQPVLSMHRMTYLKVIGMTRLRSGMHVCGMGSIHKLAHFYIHLHLQCFQYGKFIF